MGIATEISDPISTKEAARRCHVSVQRLRFAIRSGRIKAELIGRVWFVSVASVTEYRANRTMRDRIEQVKRDLVAAGEMTDPMSVCEIKKVLKCSRTWVHAIIESRALAARKESTFCFAERADVEAYRDRKCIKMIQ